MPNIEPVCPRCRGSLMARGDVLVCLGCGATYRTLRGIADLRTADDEYLANSADWEVARALDRDYDRLNFRGLLDRYYDLTNDIPDSLRARQIAHILSAPGRLGQWQEALGDRLRGGSVLDLGCGPGSTLAALAGSGRECWGVDIAMRWLILARKRLDEAGAPEVGLVCGCAERLPFAERSFTAIVAGDVVEHVRDRSATLSEAHRVLAPGGRMIAATPNRFSLGPEPHVGVWGVGFLPRRLMRPYVRLARRVDFRAIHTMGQGGWRRLANRSPFGACRVVAPGLPDDEIQASGPVKRPLARLYNRLALSRFGQGFARRFGPILHLTFERPDEPVPSPTQAIRRRSTQSAAAP